MSPTNISQYNLPAGGGGGSGSGMSRSNSIPAQDSFDLYGEGHPLGGSANSLEERPRAISRSGSFRDSTDEGEKKKSSADNQDAVYRSSSGRFVHTFNGLALLASQFTLFQTLGGQSKTLWSVLTEVRFFTSKLLKVPIVFMV